MADMAERRGEIVRPVEDPAGRVVAKLNRAFNQAVQSEKSTTGSGTWT